MPYKDKEDQRKASKRHYEKNKQNYISRSANSKNRLKKKWWDFKKSLKCINCGFNHPAALDFHHVLRSPDNRKLHELLKNQAFNAAMEEIKKCVVLCANCHRVHHYEEHQEKLRRRKSNSSNRKTSAVKRNNT